MNQPLQFFIRRHRVSEGGRCFVTAEVGMAHGGSVKKARAFIDRIAKTGADAVKFQTHIAKAESTLQEPWRVKFSSKYKSRYDYWKQTEFSEREWKSLANYARKKNLVFLSTPFSIEAVDLLKKVEISAWKVASGEITNLPMIERMAMTKKPVLLSSGIATRKDLDEAVRCIKAQKGNYAVFQTTSEYPCKAKDLGLNLIPEFKRRYRCPVGLSDHSGTIYAGLAAVALGAKLLEVHVRFENDTTGPDSRASLTFAELKKLVEGVRFIETALKYTVNKEKIASRLSKTRSIFTKSIVAKINLKAGTVLHEKHLTVKKPGIGISANRFHELIGRRLRRRVSRDQFLKENDLEENTQ